MKCIFITISLLVMLVSRNLLAQGSDDPYQRFLEQLKIKSAILDKVLGKGPDYSVSKNWVAPYSGQIHDQMLAFQPGYHLDKEFQQVLLRWKKLIYKNDLYAILEKTAPDSYYISGPLYQSSLHYKFTHTSRKYQLWESSTALVIVMEHTHPATFSGKNLATDILQTVNLPEKSVEELITAFKIPAEVKFGEFYNNHPQHRNLNYFDAREWHECVICFITEKNICIATTRLAHPPGYKPSQLYPGPTIDAIQDENWLRRVLYDKKGLRVYDLVDPDKK